MDGNRGIPRTKEVKEKISQTAKGKKFSKDSVLKGIETRTKNGSIKRSDETKMKLVLANNKAVIGWKNDDFVEYPSIKIA